MFYKRIYYGGLLAVFFNVSIFIHAQDNQADKDFYMTIAEQGQQAILDKPMDSIQPFDFPKDRWLSWNGDKSFAFNSINKISTTEEMNEALTALRNNYMPFLKDLSPNFKSERIRISIDSMQFRYEDNADCMDYNRIVMGEGSWEKIAMPYYHGPQGLSTAWYRAKVNVTDELLNKPVVMLHFNGSDYYTDAFINGHHVGFHEGMLDEFDFNIKKYLKQGENIITVKVRNDYSMLGGEGVPRFWGNKLAASNCPGWDDPFSGWSCCPSGFGIYQDLYIEGRSEPYIADIFCRPILSKSGVELWVEIDLDNGEKADEFVVAYSLYGQNFESTIVEDQRNIIRVEGGRVLKRYFVSIPDDKLSLWEPDAPWLYQMQVSLFDKNGNSILDNKKQQFGMREFVISETSNPKGRMYLNGKEIRLRGANTMGFLQKDVMTKNWDLLINDLLLAKLTNMNFIRTTQRIVQKEVYEYADRLGIMMQADLPLFAYINQKQYTEIVKQAGNIERVLRNHPSVIMMSYLNESMAEVKPHAISRYAYERLFDVLDIIVKNENPDRSIKYVDGDYQAPNKGYPDNHCYNIWYDGHGIELEDMCRGAWMPVSQNWMYGCGEFGAEGLDPVSLMRKAYPVEWLKLEADGSWSPKYMRGVYTGEQTYKMHWNWFETQSTMDSWIKESQEHQAWGVKKVSRAFRRMPRMNSFAVHLFIDAWPNGWMKAIIDSERTPKEAWFAYRDALTPLSIQIESERHSFFSGENYPFQVWICNDTYNIPESQLRYTLEVNDKIINSGFSQAILPTVTEGSLFQGYLPVNMPDVKKRSKLKLRIALIDNKSSKIIHEDQVECSVYPPLKKNELLRIYQLGQSSDSEALAFLHNNCNVVTQGPMMSDDIIVIADSLIFESRKTDIVTAVQSGARALILKDALSLSTFEDLKIESRNENSWMISRNANHSWLKKTTSTDLKYPYSSTLNKPERYEFSHFSSDRIIPILTYKNNSVIAEKEDDKGKWFICGLKLDGKINSSPVLSDILLKIFRQ